MTPSSEASVTHRKFMSSLALAIVLDLTGAPIRLPIGKQNKVFLSKAKVKTLIFSV